MIEKTTRLNRINDKQSEKTDIVKSYLYTPCGLCLQATIESELDSFYSQISLILRLRGSKYLLHF